MDRESLESLLKIKFKNKGLLTAALTHRSFLNESRGATESNERLEFLGDAVLELVVSEELYQRLPKMPEGDLTALRSNLVRTTTLAKVAKALDLGQHLRMSRGEAESGGRENPSMLADTLEALIGAIYLEQGMAEARKFIRERVISRLEEVLTQRTFKDHKSLFQEAVQEAGKPSPEYEVLRETGPDHAKIFRVGVFVEGQLVAQGSGNSKQTASQKAAKKALANWPR